MASRWTPGYTAPVLLHLVGPDSWNEVPALLCYDPVDPFAVRVVFGGGEDAGAADPEAGVSWLLGRDLLREGTRRPAGHGDVRLWPSRGAADVLYLHLSAPSGEALFEVSRSTVTAFLRATEDLVPVGAEAALLDLDDELAAILSSGGADPTGR
ncbi:SsgA family sporulation/cell division regulator [Geodermatophilus sp. YIM 151500]|uniref:SsgA family sporulation/cell division regulator n=1 Tax=Geodermatophilus sp. YIM 151500 TaxID=2984531 RepID=UPI0021E3FD0C|nr:SsgA family sporulation/cell division regulator [Geodermatophilus sp. YIM 151500]MCV2491416.1 SsgA family sporulation/cell division regulator [Geodermatophilus sp. YIM 151500]